MGVRIPQVLGSVVGQLVDRPAEYAVFDAAAPRLEQHGCPVFGPVSGVYLVERCCAGQARAVREVLDVIAQLARTAEVCAGGSMHEVDFEAVDRGGELSHGSVRPGLELAGPA